MRHCITAQSHMHHCITAQSQMHHCIAAQSHIPTYCAHVNYAIHTNLEGVSKQNNNKLINISIHLKCKKNCEKIFQQINKYIKVKNIIEKVV